MDASIPSAPGSPVIVTTLEQQIACVLREIDMRLRTYPRWVKERRMLQSKADHELAAMRAVLTTLQGLQQAIQPELPGTTTTENPNK
jgi:hypothetical protein